MSLSDQRAISRLAHNTRREELLEELSAAGPQAVYGALLGYAHTRNYKTGWCAHAFREIFGAWPRPQDRCGEAEPLPGFLIEEWVALSPRKSPPLKTDKPTYERIVREEGRRSWLTCKSSTFMDDEAIKSAISRIPLSWRRDEVLKSLHSAGQQAVHAALLHYARTKRNSESAPDWARQEFAEIFGTEPSDNCSVEPLPDILIEDIEEWAAIRQEEPEGDLGALPSRCLCRVVERDEPSPLFDRSPEKHMRPQPLDENGFVKGTLMRPTEDDYWCEWK
jgi:hypothetical protein